MATKKVVEATEENPVDVLEPEVQEYIVQITDENGNTFTFVQKPLSFFGKMEFFSVTAKALEKILEDNVSITEILDVPEYDQNLPIQESAKEADVFIKAISKIVYHVPEVLGDIYCVILAVPRGKREEAKAILEANLTDEQGIKIIEVFIDQNWEILTNFFKKEAIPLWSKIAGKFQSSAQ